MSKITLQSSAEYTTGRAFNLPIVGRVTFDENNQISIEENQLEVIDLDFGFQLTQVSGGKKTDKKTVVEAEEEDPETKDPSAHSMLDELKFTDLKNLLADYPKEETKDLKNKQDITAYLKSKIA